MSEDDEKAPKKAGGTNADPAKDKKPGHAQTGPARDDDVEEIGGPNGPDPTRYGDWERKGRCIDF